MHFSFVIFDQPGYDPPSAGATRDQTAVASFVQQRRTDPENRDAGQSGEKDVEAMIGAIAAKPDGLTVYIRQQMTSEATGCCLHWRSSACNFDPDEGECREALPAVFWGDGQAVCEELSIVGNRVGLLSRKVMVDRASDDHSTS